MYAACESVVVFLLIASVPLAARFAAVYGSDWRTIGRGALYAVSASLIAAICSDLTANSLAQHPVLAAYLPVVLAGVFEEAGRVLGLWRGRRMLSRHRGDALMFGVGFGGAEMILRAAGIAFRTAVNPDAPLTVAAVQTMLTGLLLAFAIYVFHICMAVVAFRILSDERLVRRAWVLFPLMAGDHATANLAAASGFAAYPSDACALCLWSIAAPLHVALALSAWRGVSARTPRALAAAGT